MMVFRSLALFLNLIIIEIFLVLLFVACFSLNVKLQQQWTTVSKNELQFSMLFKINFEKSTYKIYKSKKKKFTNPEMMVLPYFTPEHANDYDQSCFTFI